MDYYRCCIFRMLTASSPSSRVRLTAADLPPYDVEEPEWMRGVRLSEPFATTMPTVNTDGAAATAPVTLHGLQRIAYSTSKKVEKRGEIFENA